MSLKSNSPNEASPASSGSARDPSGNAAAMGISRWLSLAATPTFSVMALLSATAGGADMICSAGGGASPLSGMVPMYLIMSLFHSAPWLKLLSPQGNGVHRS
ncbi:hypothetical protein PY650_22975 [Rhizobium calliandrae]|uniref:Uncharacterized protein n=1 Tax=Rhizobium calliandrae TaxID=1312182 RepID=A0ABT7KMF6_9HYPH|nr:hypothetical protein [Rhizobium calliandrae]MDL2408458.1 hypothetical protein [Rhizobium calliandrae]